METVYVVGIVAAAIVIIVIGWIFRETLSSGSVKVGRGGFQGRLKTRQDAPSAAASPRRAGPLFDRLRMFFSIVTAPVGTGFSVIRTFMFGSKIEFRDAPPADSSHKPPPK